MISVMLMLAGLSLASGVAAETHSWKPMFRRFASSISDLASEETFPDLPAGVRMIRHVGGRGLYLRPGSANLSVVTWPGPVGLLELWESGIGLATGALALINGTFYSNRGPLGVVLQNGASPTDIAVTAGRISRCFLAQLRQPEGGSVWAIGETGSRAPDIRKKPEQTLTAVFPQFQTGARVEHLLGGGGWIVRDGKDAHMEAYRRQGFRFREEDQDSRHTVAALDEDGGLFLLVFETGANLSRISKWLRDDRKTFGRIRHAVFFDGGSSSSILLHGKYFVSPMYVVDRARFTAFLVSRTQSGHR